MISLLAWVKSRQRIETDTRKREHMACVIKHHNLVERQLALGRDIKRIS